MFNQLISENALWHLRHIDIGIGFSSCFFHGLERQRREREKMSEKKEKKRDENTKGEEIFAEPQRLLYSFRWLYFIAIWSFSHYASITVRSLHYGKQRPI